MNFSIVIPTCNRSSSLYNTLLALSKTYHQKAQIEVIVVDNSTIKNEIGRTKKNVRKAFRWFNIKYYYSKKGGPSPARNLGIKKSTFNHIIFIDDDTIVPQNFIRCYQDSWLNNRKAKMIGGRVSYKMGFTKPKFIHPEFEWVYALHDLGKKKKEIEYPDLILSANMSIFFKKSEKKKNVFNEVLGRRYFLNYCLFGEDVELCYRFQLENKIIIYDPNIHVLNTLNLGRLEPKYYWKRIINGGAERRLLNHELKKHFKDYNGFWNWSIINNHFYIYIRNIFKRKNDPHAFWEHALFLFGYYIFGNIMIVCSRQMFMGK